MNCSIQLQLQPQVQKSAKRLKHWNMKLVLFSTMLSTWLLCLKNFAELHFRRQMELVLMETYNNWSHLFLKMNSLLKRQVFSQICDVQLCTLHWKYLFVLIYQVQVIERRNSISAADLTSVDLNEQNWLDLLLKLSLVSKWLSMFHGRAIIAVKTFVTAKSFGQY